jgi:hypothetical protein
LSRATEIFKERKHSILLSTSQYPPDFPRDDPDLTFQIFSHKIQVLKEEIGLALVNPSRHSMVLSLEELARAGEKESHFQICALPAGTAVSL